MPSLAITLRGISDSISVPPERIALLVKKGGAQKEEGGVIEVTT